MDGFNHMPANYGPLSAFGRQENGPLTNFPSYGFARTDRLQAGRVFHSDHHTEHSHADHEYEGRSQFRRPGPGTYEKAGGLTPVQFPAQPESFSHCFVTETTTTQLTYQNNCSS